MRTTDNRQRTTDVENVEYEYKDVVFQKRCYVFLFVVFIEFKELRN